MFDEATSLASSVVRRLRETETASEGALEGSEYNDMLESAASILFVCHVEIIRGVLMSNSSKLIGEMTKDILKDLKLLFGSVTAIPVQVFLTGSSIQHDMNKATQQKPEQTGYGNGEVRAVNLEVRIFLVMVTAGLVSDLVSKGASAPRVMLQESGCLGLSGMGNVTKPSRIPIVSATDVEEYLASYVRTMEWVCLQIQEGPTSVREFLEEFLSNWKFVDERCYVLATAEANTVYEEECDNRSVLEVDKYLDVVEVYIVTLLAVALHDMEHAISWVDKATIPEEKRQELLRRLHSMNYSEMTNSTDASVSPLLPVASESFAKPLKAQNQSNGENGAKQTILKFAGQRVPCFWWFRTITLKFGNGRLVISNGSILLGCLALLLYYFMRRKRATLSSVLKRQALSMKKAVSDLWQLAFSYQVNPLAAVQPLPSATHGSR
ncbi:hypothetical protein RJ640_001531 [Escallonia rubra]|uniref:Protein APEM9 n=1 Tax=Escallonia rubra TaxID=112253 RepID=A0AA88RYC8_9ASTE|nr:hypothetical protein RJ640_001531 [Escallonia rubra]